MFKVVVSDKEQSYQFEVDSKDRKVIGLSIGDNINGELLGLDGYTLTITGGSDKNGFPMRKDTTGARRIRSLLTSGVGYNPKADGVKRRKTVRGNTISEEIVQINTIVSKAGNTSIPDILNPPEPEPEPEVEAEPEVESDAEVEAESEVESDAETESNEEDNVEASSEDTEDEAPEDNVEETETEEETSEDDVEEENAEDADEEVEAEEENAEDDESEKVEENLSEAEEDAEE